MSTPFLLASLWLGALAVGDVGPTRDAYVAEDDPLGEPVKKVVYLSQNWSPSDSLRFYFTSQGSQLLPYDWFLALEQADSTTLFRDHKNILKFRYLPQLPDAANPDGLPVGFVGDEGVGRKWLGLTCAACHTSEIRYGTTGYRIDGAPTQGDVQGLLSSLIFALQETLNDPAKFERFAVKVLGSQNSSTAQALLRSQVTAAIKRRVGYNRRNFPGYDPTKAPLPPANYARLDAVGAIVNEVYHHAVKAQDNTSPTVNTKAADAPVSYPFLWDTPQHDFVQWIGIGKSGGLGDIFSLSRNVGEVLGVFGEFVIPEDTSLLSLPGYSSSVQMTALGDLENWLKTLWSPQWPADFPALDQDARAKGAVLYRQNCLECHALIDRADPNRKVTAAMRAVGTDPRTADNFFKRTGPSGKIEGMNVNFLPFTKTVPAIADASTMVTNVVVGTILGRVKNPPPDYLSQISFAPARVALVAEGAKYKGRPLNGIWATAPYLHNGSVPNLDELLQPAAKRSTSFSVGVRTFDPARVGFLTDVTGFPRFRVNGPDGKPIPGNSNAGHEYGSGLSTEERRQLLEYLKSL